MPRVPHASRPSPAWGGPYARELAGWWRCWLIMIGIAKRATNPSFRFFLILLCRFRPSSSSRPSLPRLRETSRATRCSNPEGLWSRGRPFICRKWRFLSLSLWLRLWPGRGVCSALLASSPLGSPCKGSGCVCKKTLFIKIAFHSAVYEDLGCFRGAQGPSGCPSTAWASPRV